MESSEEALKQVEQRLKDIFKCPVCYDSVGILMHQCANGHGVCPRCRHLVSSCPVCRGKFVGHPALLSHIMELLLEVFEGLTSGCKAVDIYIRGPPPTTLLRDGDMVDTSAETGAIDAAIVSRAVDVFLRQQASMLRPT